MAIEKIRKFKELAKKVTFDGRWKILLDGGLLIMYTIIASVNKLVTLSDLLPIVVLTVSL